MLTERGNLGAPKKGWEIFLQKRRCASFKPPFKRLRDLMTYFPQKNSSPLLGRGKLSFGDLPTILRILNRAFSQFINFPFGP